MGPWVPRWLETSAGTGWLGAGAPWTRTREVQCAHRTPASANKSEGEGGYTHTHKILSSTRRLSPNRRTLRQDLRCGRRSGTLGLHLPCPPLQLALGQLGPDLRLQGLPAGRGREGGGAGVSRHDARQSGVWGSKSGWGAVRCQVIPICDWS